MSARGPRARESGPRREARKDRTSTLARLVEGPHDSARQAPAAGSGPLPADIGEVLAVANGDLAATAIATARTGVPGAVLRDAALRFVREELHAPGATLYRRLGVAPEAPIERIREHYRELIAVFHPDRLGADARPCDLVIATAVNEAWNTLKHPESRARYDRLRAVPEAAPAPVVPPRAQHARHADAIPVPSAPRARWKRVREPGRLRTWLRSQSPRTLKALTFAVLLAGAGLAVLLAAPDRAPSLAIRVPDRPASAIPTPAFALSSDAFTPAPLRAARAQGEAAARGGVTVARATSASPPRIDAGNAHDVPVVASRTPEATPSAPGAPLPAAIVAVATSDVDRAARDTGPKPAATTLVSTAAPTPFAAEPARIAPPTAAEVDTLVVRFARAYEAGDFNALRDLVDPEVAQDNRMALTLASFARVFRESSSRRIELAVQERDADAERARIELAARTTLAGPDAQALAGGGTLTFVVRRRGATPVIVDIRYRERAPG